MREVAEELLRRPEIRELGAGRGVWTVGLWPADDDSGPRLIPESSTKVIRVMEAGGRLRAACWPGPVVYADEVIP